MAWLTSIAPEWTQEVVVQELERAGEQQLGVLIVNDRLGVIDCVLLGVVVAAGTDGTAAFRVC